MVVTPVDQQNLDIGSLKRARCGDAGEATADDQNAFFAWDHPCDRWLFLRERFGQNCSHGCTKVSGARPVSIGYSGASG